MSKRIFLIFLGIQTLSGTVFAQEIDNLSPKQRESYDMLIQDAEERFRVRDYGAAADLYEIAFELNDQVVLLYNIARCYELLAKYEEALLRYETYLDYPGASGKLRRRALQNIVAIQRALAEQNTPDQLESAKKESPTINDSTADETATRPLATNESIEKAETRSIVGTARDEYQSTVPIVTAQRSHTGKQILGYSLVGVGTAAMIVGSIFGGWTIAARKDFEKEGPTHERKDFRDNLKRNAMLFDVTFFSGAALAGTGLILLIVRSFAMRSEQMVSLKTSTESFREKSAPPWRPAPLVLVGGKQLAVGFTGRF